MKSILGFLILVGVKTFCHIFYRLEVKWLTGPIQGPWPKIRLLVLLNHTSLYEPLLLAALPYHQLWRLVDKMVAPAADKTMNRPIVGFFWKLMIPHASSITRKRDETWDQFMDRISDDSLIVIAPEGRMKRKGGLDSDGNPMTVRGGIADVLSKLGEGPMFIAYSGGLHHIQTPGEHIYPRLFKTIKINVEVIDIKTYKSQFPTDSKAFKLAVVEDMQRKLETNCP